MNQKKLIEVFLRRYGCAVESRDGAEKTYGILTPVKDLAVRFPQVSYGKTGYVPRAEYFLLAPAENDVIGLHRQVVCGGRVYQIVDCSYYWLSGEKYYQRAYAYEVKGVAGQ